MPALWEYEENEEWLIFKDLIINNIEESYNKYLENNKEKFYFLDENKKNINIDFEKNHITINNKLLKIRRNEKTNMDLYFEIKFNENVFKKLFYKFILNNKNDFENAKIEILENSLEDLKIINSNLNFKIVIKYQNQNFRFNGCLKLSIQDNNIKIQNFGSYLEYVEEVSFFQRTFQIVFNLLLGILFPILERVFRGYFNEYLINKICDIKHEIKEIKYQIIPNKIILLENIFLNNDFVIKGKIKGYVKEEFSKFSDFEFNNNLDLNEFNNITKFNNNDYDFNFSYLLMLDKIKNLNIKELKKKGQLFINFEKNNNKITEEKNKKRKFDNIDDNNEEVPNKKIKN
jgi:hypothetical protein